MRRILRLSAGVVAGVFAFAASPALAQDKKPAQTDAVKKLEAELAKLKAAEAEVQAQLRKLGAEPERKRTIEVVDKSKLAQAGPDKPKTAVFVQSGKGTAQYEQMTPQQIKELIVKLQVLLEEKTRAAQKEKPGTGDKPKPGAGSPDEILKRLDQLSKEIDELRRAIKR
jgi:hypothetical protein